MYIHIYCAYGDTNGHTWPATTHISLPSPTSVLQAKTFGYIDEPISPPCHGELGSIGAFNFHQAHPPRFNEFNILWDPRNG